MAPKKKEEPTVESVVAEMEFPAELREGIWSVVSFEKCVASGLTYDEADRKMRELYAERVSGLCIVTDETAARIQKRN